MRPSFVAKEAEAPAVREADALIAAVYPRLKALARRRLRRGFGATPLQPTALVHEVYLKLASQGEATWRGKTHFFAVAANALRRLLVDEARSRARLKRGGDARRVTLSDDLAAAPERRDCDLLDLEAVLERLAERDPRAARIAELKVYSGLAEAEVALELGLSVRTVEREWAHAKAWLRRELARGRSEP